MRALSAEAVAVLSGPVVPIVGLVSFSLTEPLHLATSNMAITSGGTTWLGAGALGAIEPIGEAAGEGQARRYTLSGVPSELLAVALAEPVRNKLCVERLAIIDPSTYELLDAPIVWQGTLDHMPVTHGTTSCNISVVAEDAAALYQRAKPSRYTDGDQRHLHPGDTCLRYINSQAQHADVWPAASFFRQ